MDGEFKVLNKEIKLLKDSMAVRSLEGLSLIDIGL